MRLCKAKGRTAMFHCWEQVSEIVEPSPMRGGSLGGIVKYTNAIVEYEDGTVDSVTAEDIVFLDTSKLFSKLDKEIAKWELRQNGV